MYVKYTSGNRAGTECIYAPFSPCPPLTAVDLSEERDMPCLVSSFVVEQLSAFGATFFSSNSLNNFFIFERFLSILLAFYYNDLSNHETFPTSITSFSAMHIGVHNSTRVCYNPGNNNRGYRVRRENQDLFLGNCPPESVHLAPTLSNFGKLLNSRVF